MTSHLMFFEVNEEARFCSYTMRQPQIQKIDFNPRIYPVGYHKTGGKPETWAAERKKNCVSI